MSTRAETPAGGASGERDWWLRALLVLQSPRAVFTALRDDSNAAAHARQEPLVALVYLAGIAGVLATTASGRLLDVPEFDGLLIAVWAFSAGGIYGVATYWLGGAAVYLGARLAGGRGSYRRARHLLGFAAAPLALALLTWPVRIALYGGDLFRTGGADAGAANRFFDGLELAAIAWMVALIVLGMRVVHGWSWPRSLAGSALPALAPALLLAGAYGIF